jgi:hypothetical protein
VHVVKRHAAPDDAGPSSTDVKPGAPAPDVGGDLSAPSITAPADTVTADAAGGAVVSADDQATVESMIASAAVAAAREGEAATLAVENVADPTGRFAADAVAVAGDANPTAVAAPLPSYVVATGDSQDAPAPLPLDMVDNASEVPEGSAETTAAAANINTGIDTVALTAAANATASLSSAACAGSSVNPGGWNAI